MRLGDELAVCEWILTGDTGLVIAYGANSAQNAMMACMDPSNPVPGNPSLRYCSRRVEERPPQPQRQVWRPLSLDDIAKDDGQRALRFDSSIIPLDVVKDGIVS